MMRLEKAEQQAVCIAVKTWCVTGFACGWMMFRLSYFLFGDCLASVSMPSKLKAECFISSGRRIGS